LGLTANATNFVSEVPEREALVGFDFSSFIVLTKQFGFRGHHKERPTELINYLSLGKPGDRVSPDPCQNEQKSPDLGQDVENSASFSVCLSLIRGDPEVVFNEVILAVEVVALLPEVGV